ncbi:MAG TPA: hypothetical protein VN892_06025 [Solirubrobacteraceae bacterium]|nr:hypothetical protein [Solirubrobacteraceae bacterium]
MSSGELEPIKEAGEAAAALADVFIDKTGAALVPKAYFDYVVTRIHYRHVPKLIERATATAEKIKASGLPARAYSAFDDPLLTAILEGNAEEDDPELQKVWENLLANALTDGLAPARRAYPVVLRQLEPDEALMLDRIASGSIIVLGSIGGTRAFRSKGQDGIPIATLVNLERLNLIELGHMQPTPAGKPVLAPSDALRVIRLTPFGASFVEACRPPKRPPEPAR